MKSLLQIIIILVCTSTLVFGQTPTKPSSNFTFQAISCDSIKISWKPGNGSSRVVWVTKTEDLDGSVPKEGYLYVGKSSFGSGSRIGTKTYCVYNGQDSTVTVSGIEANKEYTISIYEYNRNTSVNYLITGGTNVLKVKNENLNAKFKTNQRYQCLSGNKYIYTNQSSNSLSGAMTYSWKIGDSVTASKDLTYTHNKGGVIPVELTAKFGSCFSTFSQDDTVVVPWNLDFYLDTISGNDSIQCLVNNEFNFINSSTPPDQPIYGTYDRTRSKWFTNHGEIGRLYDFKLNTTKPDTLAVTLVIGRQVSFGRQFCDDSITKKYYVRYPIFDSTKIVCSDSVWDRHSSAPLAFRLDQFSHQSTFWAFGDKDTASGIKVTHRYDTIGIFKVTCFGEDSSGCPYYATKKIRVTDNVSLRNLQKANISLSPNPASTFLQINGAKEIVIYNSTGQLILNQKTNDQDKIDIRSLKTGVYTIVLDEIYRTQFIKE